MQYNKLTAKERRDKRGHVRRNRLANKLLRKNPFMTISEAVRLADEAMLKPKKK